MTTSGESSNGKPSGAAEPAAGARPRVATRSRAKTGESPAPLLKTEKVTSHPTDEIRWAVTPRPVTPRAKLANPALFFNRELSWLDFNWRVLHQARDSRNPLLERLRFMSITASNLDEFFMKRVGGLKRQLAAGVTQRSLDGRSPARQLELIRDAVGEMQAVMSETWELLLRSLLQDELGIVISDYADLAPAQQQKLHRYFRDSIYPILTPLAVDPGHPFPFISNLSLSLAVALRHPQRDTRHFARVKIPKSRQRWIELDEPGHYLPIEQLVARHADELFKGMVVESAHLFRLTRNADVRRAEEEADDLLKVISTELRERRFASVVRLEIETSMPANVRDLLVRQLGLESADVYEVRELLDLADLGHFANKDAPEHKFDHWDPAIPVALLHEGESEEIPDIFAVLKGGDVLVHHPYDSFAASVQRFVEEAAADRRVLAIKQTLYRTSEDSPIVRALVRAAESGKQVAVLVEVTARFDEQENMEWGQMLENSGVHVTYGLVGLKTHAKVALVVRDEEDGIKTYCHIGTGNYHSGTARQYTDLGVLTAKPAIGSDVVNLFHYITGYAPEQVYKKLLVAPRDLRKKSIDLIKREIKHQKTHGTGRIIAKMNAIDDAEIMRALYRASQAGVQIDLIVRGLCRLRPGLEGISENIRVISIIGRFLEHDRIFWFANNDKPRVFLGSADWRRRNLDDRVEALLRVEDPDLMARLRAILDLALSDDRRAWDLGPDGHYALRTPGSGEDARDYHELLMDAALHRRAEAEAPWDIRPAKARKKKKKKKRKL